MKFKITYDVERSFPDGSVIHSKGEDIVELVSHNEADNYVYNAFRDNKNPDVIYTNILYREISDKQETSTNAYSELEYESLRDEAWNMAHTLQDIEKEVKDCAFCGGREDCGYSAMRLLKELCYIFTRDVGYHRMDKYDMKKEIEKGNKS